MAIVRLRTLALKGIAIAAALLLATPAFAGSQYSSVTAEASALIGTGRFTQILIYATNNTSTAGFVEILDTTTIPSTGATVIPRECIALPANATASIRYDVGPYTLFNNGVVVLMSSAANCYLFTSGTITGFIKGYVQ